MSLLSKLLDACVEVKHWGVIKTRDYDFFFDDGDDDNINFYNIAGDIIKSIPLPKKPE